MKRVLSMIVFMLVNLVYSIYTQPSDETGVLSGNKSFNEYVVNELKQLKAFQKHAGEQIAYLEQQNHEKDMKIEALEKGLSLLNEASTQSVTHLRKDRAVNSHIAFTAYLTHPITGITHSQPIKFDRVLLNDGNVYDSTTGEFTAPVSGVYLFSYSVGAKHTSGSLSQYDVFTRLVVNGVHQVSAVSESVNLNDDEQGSTTATIYALEGDKVWVMVENRGSNQLYSAADERVTSFTGFLLYESGSIVG